VIEKALGAMKTTTRTTRKFRDVRLGGRGQRDGVGQDQGRTGALAGAVTVSKGVKMFQLNDEGAIVGVSLTAAKYYKDKELN
jgi:hypothetical protein